MIELLTNPAITLPFTALGGWAMKLIAIGQDRRQQERIHTLDAFKAAMGESITQADAAAARSGDTWGKLTRRGIAWSLVVLVALLCLLPGFTMAPAIVQTVSTSSGFLWGLFGGGSSTEFHELRGFIHSPAVLSGFAHIIVFYFGQGAAKP